MRTLLVTVLALFVELMPLARTRAQVIDVPARALESDSALMALAPRIAALALQAERGQRTESYLGRLARVQIVAEHMRDARATLRQVRSARARHAGLSPHAYAAYEVYAAAFLRKQSSSKGADSALRGAMDQFLRQTSDHVVANETRYAFGTSLQRLESVLRDARIRMQGGGTRPIEEVIDLLNGVAAVKVYRALMPIAERAFEADDRRRYVIQRDVRVPMPDGATVCALVIRPRSVARRFPALLEFTVYADSDARFNETRLSASRQYVGVAALSRGKGCSPDQPDPMTFDGSDAAAVIAWIAGQPWSDGRVGMFGGSYNGFTQWAAAKRRPPALKVIMPSVSFAPGVDFPMEGNVFMSYAHPWPFYTTNNKTLDNATYRDDARWRRRDERWYTSGAAYRSLDSIDGTPNPIFNRWLSHPSYDSFWRSFTPSAEEFANIDIPVLTTTGYYDSGQIGALHYFRNHLQNRPGANHYLVIGPYDHISAQRGTASPLGRSDVELRGLPLDSVARLDIIQLRYGWFDHVLKGAPKPALLGDRVNYEVMGANIWRHARTIGAMADSAIELFATRGEAQQEFRLAAQRSRVDTVATHVIDLKDRSDVERLFDKRRTIDQTLDDWAIVDSTPRLANAILFTGEPLRTATEVSGLFSARLEFVTNKKDFDVGVTLLELTPTGEYVHLAYVLVRASYAADRSRRSLLGPGVPNVLEIEGGRLTSRLVHPGSRLVVAVAILKQPFEQINYGSGKQVSDETLADAGDPLRITWLAGTRFRFPIRR